MGHYKFLKLEQFSHRVMFLFQNALVLVKFRLIDIENALKMQNAFNHFILNVLQSNAVTQFIL